MQRAIEALTHDKTIIMIAHRLKTVRNVDQILVLNNAHIVQRGTHAELIRQKGLYADFVSARQGGHRLETGLVILKGGVLMALTSAMEDYLEAVLMMQQRHGYVRCVDVAEHLGVKKPSVSRAVKELSKSGHLVKKR